MNQLETLREHWNAFSLVFQQRCEPTTLQLAGTLLHQLQLGQATALLEVGAGAGGAAVQALRLLPDGAPLRVTDLAPAMIELARAALPESVVV